MLATDTSFSVLADAVEKQWNEMSKGELYVTDASDLFEHYLASFPEGSNPVFRERTEHDCSCCKQFVRNVGNVVAIRNGQYVTIWDVDVPEPYATVAKAMASHVRDSQIVSVFRTKELKFGAKTTVEIRDNGTTHTWSHFYAKIGPHRVGNPGTVKGQVASAFQVLRRGLTEITLSAVDEVLDLINSNALYRGAEFKGAVEGWRVLLANKPENLDLYVWNNVQNPAACFRNTVIGTLVQDISDGVDIEKAVKSFESKVAPTNYKRPTALITPKMIAAAVETLQELNLESAVERRFARLEDVSVNDVLFVDNSARGKMKGGLEGVLLEAVKPQAVSIDNATPIGIDDFLANILPQATSIDLLLENKHLGNFVSLTAPVHEDAGCLFKWGNNFAWSYDGDVADSIKQRVKSAGGKIDALMRTSLAWSNYDDLDIHVIEPCGNRIYFGSKRGRTGVLDVDMNAGWGRSRKPVENVAFSKIVTGVYEVDVNQYCRRETTDVGFTLEFEHGGEIKQYHYDKAVQGTVKCLNIHVVKGKLERVEVIEKNLKAGDAATEKWGVTTTQLVQVNSLMASPNYWSGRGVGNKHWFFILKDCVNPLPARGIYNEFLKPELEKHRKVFEVLASKTKCPVTQDQLSGVGFSSTRGDVAVVVVKGNKINKAFSIQF